MSNKYDAIVIGAGIGGLGTAAVLAKDFNKKVLVLEKNPFIGGRVASFVGKEDKVTIDGMELDVDGFKQALEASKCWLASCTPDINTIFEKGLLDGYTFESGGHGLFWGNKGRVRFLLNHLNKPVDIPTNTGFAFVDYENGNKASQVGTTPTYQWMSEEGFAKTMEALKKMGKLSMEEAAANMNISLQEWLDKQDLHPEAYDYIKVLAASQTAMAEPLMTPAGDFLSYMAISKDIKMNLIKGSVGTISNPGCMAIPLAMEQCILEHGGEVRRNAPVEDTIIENGQVKGVVVHTENGTETIYADVVVCNLPPKYIFNVVHRRHFPAEWVKKVTNEFWSPGLLSAFIGLKENVWAEKGIEERSFIYMPGVIRNEKYYGDALLQKTITVDFLNHKRKENKGQAQKFMVNENHPPIISKEIFDKVQDEKERRALLKGNLVGDRHKYSSKYPFSGKVFCGSYGNIFRRRQWNSTNTSKKIVWQCKTS